MASLRVERYPLEDLRRLGIEVIRHGQIARCSQLIVKPTLFDKVKAAQLDDLHCKKIREELDKGGVLDFAIGKDGVLRFRGRLCIPHNDELRKDILTEAHSSRYSIHPGSTKMYRDLREHLWWSGTKRDIAEFVAQCLTCQQIKVEHQRPAGKLQSLTLPEWKWEHITMDFVSGLPRTRAGHDTVWVIVDRLTKSAHFIATKKTFALDKLAQLYVREIIRLHGAPVSIVSDRDPRFVSRFWNSL